LIVFLLLNLRDCPMAQPVIAADPLELEELLPAIGSAQM
jgi:hypothetical protein